jgi:alpha-galactosidase
MLGQQVFDSRGVHRLIAGKGSSAQETQTVIATRFVGGTDREGFPREENWENASWIPFDHDWQGKNADPQRETRVRLLWSPDALYVCFLARYRTITVFDDSEPNGRRDHLWDRDVAEVFLQPAGSDQRHYKEFEVSPNGLWIDLEIAPGEKYALKSGLKRRVRLDEQKKMWTAEMILPMKSLTARFDPANAWRTNFFRIEGASEPRFYSAWRPTGTPVPNFHVPEAFGVLTFAK